MAASVLAFTDGTAFDLSPNARMVMNEFIYDPNSKSNSSLLSLTKGTFTFVAGKIAKSGDMKVNTPVATMGIRGTTPRVEIAEDGSVKFSTLIEEGRGQRQPRSGAGRGSSCRRERQAQPSDLSRLLTQRLGAKFYLVCAMPTQISPLRPDRLVLVGAAVLFLLNLSADASSAPQSSRLISKMKNIELCNGSDRSSPEPQIRGCTALINDENETTLVRAVAHNNRGDAYVAQGNFEAAINDYDQAISLNPDFARPFNNRGFAYLKKGDSDRALKDFDQAIKLKPDYGRAFANRAEAYQLRHDYQSAARDYDTAVRLHPDMGAVWNGRCWTRAILGELQPALADCNKALSLKPNDAAALNSRGLIYLKMGQFEFRDQRLQLGIAHRTSARHRALRTRACPNQEGRRNGRQCRSRCRRKA